VFYFIHSELVFFFLSLAATRDSSNLLAHEAAFALGQMQEQEAIPALTSVLNDLSLHPIVRHEVVEKRKPFISSFFLSSIYWYF
jgi:HEAT repeat protein